MPWPSPASWSPCCTAAAARPTSPESHARVVLAVALLVYAGVQILSFDRDCRNFALLLEETKTELLHMEEIWGTYVTDPVL